MLFLLSHIWLPYLLALTLVITTQRISPASAGGGMFGIKKLINSHSKPDTILLSPDGRWLLLGYISELILMNTDTNECLLCVCNYDASPIYKTGFIDENSIWYTQGHSTYIQKIYSSISNEY